MSSNMSSKKKSNTLIELPAIRINQQLEQQIQKVFELANKKEKVAEVDFLRECIRRGLQSFTETLRQKNLKIGYLKANTVDGIYFYGDFLKNNEEILSIDEFIKAMAVLEERQEITTFIGADQEDVYFQLVKDYGISHYQYFAKQDGEKLEYNVFHKDSEKVFLRCFSETAFVAQQHAIAIYLDRHPEEGKRDIRDLAKEFKVLDKFKMLGANS
jgi:hypothetical protein